MCGVLSIAIDYASLDYPIVYVVSPDPDRSKSEFFHRYGESEGSDVRFIRFDDDHYSAHYLTREGLDDLPVNRDRFILNQCAFLESASKALGEDDEEAED